MTWGQILRAMSSEAQNRPPDIPIHRYRLPSQRSDHARQPRPVVQLSNAALAPRTAPTRTWAVRRATYQRRLEWPLLSYRRMGVELMQTGL